MKQAEKSALTKQNIIQAAMSLYEESGMDAVSISDICKLANIAVGTFYYYFSSKEDIFTQVNQDAVVNLAKMLGQFKDETDPETYLQKFFTCYAEQNRVMGTDGIARLRYDRYVRSAAGKSEPRRIFVLLENRLAAFQQENLMPRVHSAEHITNEMFICARGLIFEWCVENGSFDLIERMQQHMMPYIKYYTS